MQQARDGMRAAIRATIIDLLRSTNREGIEDLIGHLESTDFFVAPASTKYHGSYDGGLAQHSLNVYTMMRFLTEVYEDSGIKIPAIEKDSLIITSICHDLTKINTYHPDFKWSKDEQNKWIKIPTYKRETDLPMGHGGKSVFILQKFIQLTDQEAQAIFWHMGAWDISPYMTLNELSQTFEDNLLALLLHMADLSTTYISENKNY